MSVYLPVRMARRAWERSQPQMFFDVDVDAPYGFGADTTTGLGGADHSLGSHPTSRSAGCADSPSFTNHNEVRAQSLPGTRARTSEWSLTVSFYDYTASKYIAAEDYPFYTLIMAAMRKADTPNTEKLKAAWPDVYAELSERYNAPGGLLAGEQVEA